MSSEIVPVLVTGVGGGGHGEQIVKALRLGKLEYRIIGTDMSKYSVGIRMADDFFSVPRTNTPEYLPRILELAEEVGAKAIFHGSEADMMLFSRNHSTFAERGLYLPVNPPSVIDLCQDKVKTNEFLRRHGFPGPEFAEISTIDDLDAFDRLPAVLKPSVGGGGSANVLIAQSIEELRQFGRYLLSVCNRLIVQEYVGSPEQEFTVGVLFGSDGRLINSIAVRRVIGNALTVRLRVPNLSARRELGPTLVISSGVSQGEVGHWPAVTEPCERIAAALEPTAPVNIQCRFVDGVVVPFEINPRFSGTTSIRAQCGYNEPDVLVRRDVFGESIEERFNYEEATIVRGLSEYRL